MQSVQLDFLKMDGLLPAVVQDATTKDVLMVGFMDEAAWHKTLETGHVTFWSRTRNKLWTKGETSGHFLVVRRIRTDCDHDTVLVEADPIGPTCHTGAYSCFFNIVETSPSAESAGGADGALGIGVEEEERD